MEKINKNQTNQWKNALAAGSLVHTGDTCFGKPACAFVASRAIPSCQNRNPTEAASFGDSGLQVSDGAVGVRTAPRPRLIILDIILSTAEEAVSWSTWSVFIDPENLYNWTVKIYGKKKSQGKKRSRTHTCRQEGDGAKYLNIWRLCCVRLHSSSWILWVS